MLEGLLGDMRYISGAFDDDSVYEEVGRVLNEFDEQAGMQLDRVFYLSTAPQFFPAIAGKVGAAVKILGTNLTGATSVTFNGMTAVFKPGSKTFLTATVPAEASTGVVKVVTSGGTMNSNVNFRVTK